MMRRFGTLLLTLGMLTAGNLSLHAAITFTDFSDVSTLKLNGNASQVGNTLQLTPATFDQSGSAFTLASTPLGNLNSFSTHFRFQITGSGGLGDGDGPGADGIVFVIQTFNNNAGGSGGGLGYAGIPGGSLGVEFDTFNNGEVSGNHAGVDLNGSVGSVVAAAEAVRFNNGQVWDAWVDYNGATLEVRWSNVGIRPVLSQLSYTVNLVTQLNQNSAFLGFTAGTGSGYGDQRILSWEYRDEFNPIGTVPEPASLTLWGLGALGCAIAGLCRRKLA